ncbi:uncharacterized protein LOC141646490 [Silene latifolia]|uniref:uncharacterized protein LOC141646490 n=1 Tax=Silene latifolia TaxID=37657 RepID=UPI003D77FAA3
MEEAFSLSVTPAMNLILAINALVEVDFNSPRIARIDVGERGFEITVYDNRVDDGIPTEIFKSVSFDAASMTEFNCQIPLSQMIELDEIIRLLDPVDYHGSVRIFSADGTMLSVASLDSHG